MYPRLAYKVIIFLVTTLLLVLVLTGLYNADFLLLFVMPLILILPGYALTSAIFPRGMFNNSERLTMSLGVSLSLTVLSGLLFFWLGLNFGVKSWAIMLGGLMLIAWFVALIRSKFKLTGLQIQKKLALGDILLLGLTALILVGALKISRSGAVHHPFNDFTQLWIMPSEHKERNSAHIGILNEESEKIDYSLHLEVDNSLIAKWEPIGLEPGESWETTFELPIDNDAQIIIARLFSLNDPQTSYREVWLWLDN